MFNILYFPLYQYLSVYLRFGLEGIVIIINITLLFCVKYGRNAVSVRWCDLFKSNVILKADQSFQIRSL